MILNRCQRDSKNSEGCDSIKIILGDKYEKVIFSNVSRSDK